MNTLLQNIRKTISVAQVPQFAADIRAVIKDASHNFPDGLPDARYTGPLNIELDSRIKVEPVSEINKILKSSIV